MNSQDLSKILPSELWKWETMGHDLKTCSSLPCVRTTPSKSKGRMQRLLGFAIRTPTSLWPLFLDADWFRGRRRAHLGVCFLFGLLLVVSIEIMGVWTCMSIGVDIAKPSYWAKLVETSGGA